MQTRMLSNMGTEELLGQLKIHTVKIYLSWFIFLSELDFTVWFKADADTVSAS